MGLNCGVGEDSWESLGDSQVTPKGNQSWISIGRTDAEAETPKLWPSDGKSWLTGKEPHAGKDWRREETGKTGWAGWMASLTQWTWVWVNSGSWWWTGRPGVLRSMGSQRVGHDWVTEQQLLSWDGDQNPWVHTQAQPWAHSPPSLLTCHLRVPSRSHACVTALVSEVTPNVTSSWSVPRPLVMCPRSVLCRFPGHHF